jgi:hypothetical protein
MTGVVQGLHRQLHHGREGRRRLLKFAYWEYLLQSSAQEIDGSSIKDYVSVAADAANAREQMTFLWIKVELSSGFMHSNGCFSGK